MPKRILDEFSTKLDKGKRMYARRVRLGLCVRCGNDANGFTLCATHRTLQNQKRKAKVKKQFKPKGSIYATNL